MTTVVDAEDRLLGVFTDGDLRRVVDRGVDLRGMRMDEVMTRAAKTAHPSMLAAEAVHLMEEYRITALPVVDTGSRVVAGALNVHDLMRAGVV
jgi:arabinose-5-phosphate isomerase